MKFLQLVIDCEKCKKDLVIMKVFVNAEDVWQFDCLCPHCGLYIVWTSLPKKERVEKFKKKDTKLLAGKSEIESTPEDKKFLKDMGISEGDEP